MKKCNPLTKPIWEKAKIKVAKQDPYAHSRDMAQMRIDRLHPDEKIVDKRTLKKQFPQFTTQAINIIKYLTTCSKLKAFFASQNPEAFTADFAYIEDYQDEFEGGAYKIAKTLRQSYPVFEESRKLSDDGRGNLGFILSLIVSTAHENRLELSDEMLMEQRIISIMCNSWTGSSHEGLDKILSAAETYNAKYEGKPDSSLDRDLNNVWQYFGSKGAPQVRTWKLQNESELSKLTKFKQIKKFRDAVSQHIVQEHAVRETMQMVLPDETYLRYMETLKTPDAIEHFHKVKSNSDSKVEVNAVGQFKPKGQNVS